jgi:hypothetical protein
MISLANGEVKVIRNASVPLYKIDSSVHGRIPPCPVLEAIHSLQPCSLM